MCHIKEGDYKKGSAKPTLAYGIVLTVDSMDESELSSLLIANGTVPPTERIAAVCSRIEEMTQEKAPMKLAQHAPLHALVANSSGVSAPTPLRVDSST